MPKYSFKYFNARGRGEIGRLALVYAGADWEDNRVEWGEQWENLKPSTPLSMLPVLVVDGGLPVSESLVIAQFIAEEYNFGGSNSAERAQVRMIVQYLDSLFSKIANAHFEQDPGKKEELKKEIQTKLMPDTFSNLEKLLAKNASGVFVGSGITTADLQLQNVAGVILGKLNTALDSYPGLKALFEKVSAEPKIASWLNSRPETKF